MKETALAAGRAWISPRRKRFWALVLVVAYTLLGFFAVPWALKRQLPTLAQEYLQRDARVGEVAFNPWMLRLQATDLDVLDVDGTPLLGVAALEVNLQTRSLLRLGLVFSDVRLDNPRFRILRRAVGDSNIGNWIDELTAAPETEAAAAEDDSGLRLVIDRLRIAGAVINVVDQVPATAFSTRFGPVDISLDNLSTFPNEAGQQEVVITTETGAELGWAGSLQASPLESAGSLRLDGSPLGVVHRYFSDQLNFSFDDCCLDVELDYAIQTRADGTLEVAVDNAALSLREVLLKDPTEEVELLSLPELAVSGGSLRWPAATAQVDSVVIDSPALNAWLAADGTLNLAGLFEPAGDATDSAKAAQPVTGAAPDAGAGDDWTVTVDELRIDSMQVGVADRQLSPPGRLALENLDVRLTDISNQPEQRIPLTVSAAIAGGGTVALEGDTALLPAVALTAQLSVDALALQQFQPWIQASANVAIDAGTLNLQARLQSTPSETLDLRGDLTMAQLEVSDGIANERLVGFSQLRLDDLNLALDAAQLEISSVTLDQPFARVLIDEQGATNFAALTATDPAAPTPAASDETVAATPEFTVRVGDTRVAAGAMDFTDLALPLPFQADISELNGRLSALDSASEEPSKLTLEGQVGQFGLAAIDGNLNVLDPTRKADIELRFRNISMPDLSPYTAKFAGRKINSGKLDLTLDYAFEEQLMKGDNQVILSDFELGDKVEYPGAMNLPLGLAVALLRDVNGKIDLSLGVSGDLDDPSFSASGIILKAFANLITKAAAAPFKLLGGLLPSGSKVKLDSVLFRPGRADLAPPEEEKLTLLSDALTQRPSLVLDVAGGANPELDVPALQAAAVEALLEEELGARDPGTDREQLLRRTRKALEKLIEARGLPDELTLDDLESQFTEPASADAAERFDEVAYMADLRLRLEAAQPVAEQQLDKLAAARAAAIVDALAALGLDTTRIRRLEPAPAASTDDGWVRVKLGLEAGTAPAVQTAADAAAL